MAEQSTDINAAAASDEGWISVDDLIEENANLRAALATADAACRTYWGWEYGPMGDNDVPDTRLLIAWAEDFNRRGGDAKVG